MKKTIPLKTRVIRKYNYLLDKRVLKDNLAFKNLYAGKRCFILGNGPSIKNQDLLKLANEWTFVVNSFHLHPQYNAINPKFHAIVDSRYFQGDEESLRFLKEASDKAPESTTMILPLKAKQVVEKNNFFSKNKKIYLYVKGFLSDKKQETIEIDKTTPTPMSVSVACLMTAIYMGFDPIYLMGLEHDWLTQKSIPNVRTDVAHFYDDKQNQYFSAEPSASYEMNCWSTYLLFKNYRLLKRGITNKIFNLTPNSYLDVFPFKKYEEVL